MWTFPILSTRLGTLVYPLLLRTIKFPRLEITSDREETDVGAILQPLSASKDSRCVLTPGFSLRCSDQVDVSVPSFPVLQRCKHWDELLLLQCALHDIQLFSKTPILLVQASSFVVIPRHGDFPPTHHLFHPRFLA